MHELTVREEKTYKRGFSRTLLVFLTLEDPSLLSSFGVFNFILTEELPAESNIDFVFHYTNAQLLRKTSEDGESRIYYIYYILYFH